LFAIARSKDSPFFLYLAPAMPQGRDLGRRRARAFHCPISVDLWPPLSGEKRQIERWIDERLFGEEGEPLGKSACLLID